MLKRGGRWQGLEGLLSGAPISEAQEEAHAIAQSTDRISKRWLILTFLTSPSAWVNRASQESMEATNSYDQGLREGVFSYRFRVRCTAEVEDHAARPHGYPADCPSCGQDQSKKKTNGPAIHQPPYMAVLITRGKSRTAQSAGGYFRSMVRYLLLFRPFRRSILDPLVLSWKIHSQPTT